MRTRSILALTLAAAAIVAVAACGDDDPPAGAKNGGPPIPDGGIAGGGNDPATDPIGTVPLNTHPRMLVRGADLDRLRGWAAADNPIYTQGLRSLAEEARGRMDRGEPARDDNGGTTGTELPTESFAMIFAFMSLVAPEAERADWANRARTMLMSVIDEAAKGVANGEKFRDEDFAVDDRSRWHGEGFALTVDWIYGTLTADDKTKIRNVFLRWADEITHATVTNDNHPEPIGVINDPRLIANKKAVRGAANNYYAAHIRNLGLMAVAMDAADDPEEKLRGYLKSVAGAWLYVSDALMRGDMAGGLGAEGFQYSPQSLGYVAQLLAALYTSGRADPNLYGYQVTFANPFWEAAVPAYLHSLSPATQNVSSQGGAVYTLASYGDEGGIYAEGMIGMFGGMAIQAGLANNPGRLAAVRWAETHTPPGGESTLVDRSEDSGFYINSILSFMMFEPKAPPAADPRPQIPLVHVAPGLGRVLARTGWGTDASWFTYKLGWNSIDHQHSDGNMIELYRKGEWLTKGRTGYGLEIACSDYKNTLTIQNNVPDHNEGYRRIAYLRGSQWPYVSDDDGKMVAQSSSPKFAYVLGDSTALYNSQNEKSTDVAHASRSVVWLAPDRIVTYDRAASKTANRFKRFWLNLPANGTVAGGLMTMNSAGGQKLFVRSLLPGTPITVEAAEPLGDQPATGDPTRFRMRVDADAAQLSARFLHVIQGADGGGAADNAVLISSTGGTPYQGATADNVAVMFPVDVGAVASVAYTAPGGTRAHIITGLAPNTGYTVNVSGSNVSVTPGAGQTTDAGGVLVIGTL